MSLSNTYFINFKHLLQYIRKSFLHINPCMSELVRVITINYDKNELQKKNLNSNSETKLNQRLLLDLLI